MADNPIDSDGVTRAIDQVDLRTRDLERSASGFGRAMTSAFAQSATGARGLDDTLKTLALRLSNLSVRAAFRPVGNAIGGGIDQLFAGLFGGGGAAGNVAPNLTAAMDGTTPFAAGGVIGTPSYFPLTSGGLGLAGEAGPEAILPLARGADGRLGVAYGGGAAGANITVNIATPDAESFRRSESYLTGQIARAVARGQRSL